MVWLLVTGLGLVLESSVIVALGRHVTGPYERARGPEAGDVSLVRRR
jgi:hypothetical protein